MCSTNIPRLIARWDIFSAVFSILLSSLRSCVFYGPISRINEKRKCCILFIFRSFGATTQYIDRTICWEGILHTWSHIRREFPVAVGRPLHRSIFRFPWSFRVINMQGSCMLTFTQKCVPMVHSSQNAFLYTNKWSFLRILTNATFLVQEILLWEPHHTKPIEINGKAYIWMPWHCSLRCMCL